MTDCHAQLIVDSQLLSLTPAIDSVVGLPSELIFVVTATLLIVINIILATEIYCINIASEQAFKFIIPLFMLLKPTTYTKNIIKYLLLI